MDSIRPASAVDQSGVDRSAVDDVVDAHVHVWDPRRIHYPWMVETPPLARPFGLDDVAHAHARHGIVQVVLVQAADDVDDTELMLEAARSHPQVAGVVGWVPLRDPRTAAGLIERWRDAPVVGFRHLVHREPDPHLLRSPDASAVLDLIAEAGRTFDVCAESIPLLALVPDIADRHRELTLVIDHLAKPPIRDGGWEPWAGLLREAAACPNVVTKLSGLNTAAAAGAGAVDFAPYVDHALECFGPDRVMFGGDWPFALLAADSYEQIWAGLRPCLDGLPEPDRHAVLSATARRVYGLATRISPNA